VAVQDDGLGVRGPVQSPTFVLARTHPNPAGYDKIAATFFTAIRSTLEVSTPALSTASSRRRR